MDDEKKGWRDEAVLREKGGGVLFHETWLPRIAGR